MKRHPLLWTGLIVALGLSLLAVLAVVVLHLPSRIGLAIGLMAVLLAVATMLLEERAPLQ